MIIFTSFFRIISFAWKNFIRNAWISLTTVFVLTLALLSINVLIGVNVLADAAIHNLEDKIDVSVYFKPGTQEVILNQARNYMSSLPQTASVSMLSADESLQEFKKRHFNDQDVLDALNELEENPLGATMIIKANKTTDYSFLMQALQNPQFSSSIESKTYDDHSTVIKRVHDIAYSIRYFGIFLVSIFVIFSILIVYNAIRVAIYTQREEIGIMRLVGASNSFVRLPLIIDGVFFALLALGIVVIIMFFIASFLNPYLYSFFNSDPGLLNYYSGKNALNLFFWQGISVILIVILSSWAAVGRYLKK